MYAKTEIFHMMKDKVIPTLLNSEKRIQIEDIKEVLEKSSYWKGKDINNKSKDKYIKNFFDIKFSKKKKLKSFVVSKTKKEIRPHCPLISFCNPLLNKISKGINSLPEIKKENNFSLKIQKIKPKMSKCYYFKNRRENSENNNSYLRDFEYKTIYCYNRKRIKKIKMGDSQIKKDEEKNRLILRGIGMNEEQKKCYVKCQLYNIYTSKMGKNKLNKNKSNKETFQGLTKKPKIKLQKKKINFNIAYSLKDLLNWKSPVIINS